MALFVLVLHVVKESAMVVSVQTFAGLHGRCWNTGPNDQANV